VETGAPGKGFWEKSLCYLALAGERPRW